MRVRPVVVKVGSSTVTLPNGEVDTQVVTTLSREIASLWSQGRHVVVVSSGAIAAGWSALAHGGERPHDTAVLQAVSAVGQHRLMRTWDEGFGRHGLLTGQVLLAPLDFVDRRQYLHARATLEHLFELGVVPVVNENDAVADEEIRFGDNDRLSALVAHLVNADLLIMLTDTPGLLDADPRMEATASLIEEVIEIDHHLEQVAGGPGSPVGSGGMASKLAAAKIATWSGVEVVIASGRQPGILESILSSTAGAGTVFRPRERTLTSRKLWIAFAVAAKGSITVDAGARHALEEEGRSLLLAGVTGVTGEFVPDDAVEILDAGGQLFAKGISQMATAEVSSWMGRRSIEIPDGRSGEVVHRDDLVILS
ncbi:MAG: glutamate 5-kinase [Actinomycetota bacterium]|nr:glutamate 5-kinase [Actinomycetota bacterium]